MKTPQLYVEKIDAHNVRQWELDKLHQYAEKITYRGQGGESAQQKQWFRDELCKTLKAIANLRARGVANDGTQRPGTNKKGS